MNLPPCLFSVVSNGVEAVDYLNAGYYKYICASVLNVSFHIFSFLFQTAETELKQYFSAFGPVKDAKIIADRAGVSKG